MDGINFFIFVLSSAGILLAVYLYLKISSGGYSKKDKAEVFFPTTAAEMSKKGNFVTKNTGNGYIQNNAAIVSRRICILTPSFNAESFMEFAKEIFLKLTNDRGTAELYGVVADDIDLSELPDKIEKYDHCFINKLILTDNSEKIVTLMTVDNGESIMAERYFVAFSRKSSMKNITKGGVIAVSCPSCGAALSFEQKAMKICPYCGKPVKYAEYDWVLTSVERITNETVVDNRAIVEE